MEYKRGEQQWRLAVPATVPEFARHAKVKTSAADVAYGIASPAYFSVSTEVDAPPAKAKGLFSSVLSDGQQDARGCSSGVEHFCTIFTRTR